MIIFTHFQRPAFNQFNQHRIPGGMAEDIVYFFEVIDVDQKQRRLHVAALGAVQFLADKVNEAAAIERACQTVGPGKAG